MFVVNRMIEVTFFEDGKETYTEKEYKGECASLIAALDMDEHIRKGGWCMATYKNKSVMVTSIKQLGFE